MFGAKQHYITRLMVLGCFLLMNTSCENIFEDVADKDTPDAIFYEAKKQMNLRNWDAALILLQSLGPSYLSSEGVAPVYASAYSGRCGLDFLSLVSNLENLGSAANIFTFLMDIYREASTAKIADCVQAESIINSLGDVADRSVDENLLMGLSSLTKVGVILNARADLDADGAVDGSFDYCQETTAANPVDVLTDDDMREIGTGIANALLSAAASGSDINPDALDDIRDFCALTPDLAVFCTTTDKTVYTDNQVHALRAAVGSTQVGIGACAGSVAACLFACPP